MLVKVNNCGNGVNKDLLPSELAPGEWSDSLNVRFQNQFARRRKGIQSAWMAPVVAPYFLTTYITTAGRFLVEAGIARVHVDDGTTQTEITRFTDGVAIASITRVGTTATLTTSAAHGRTTGNTVTVFGAADGGATSFYNGTFVITVTGATTFTYTMGGTPPGSATTVGQYSYNVQADFTGAIDDRWTGGPFNGVLVLNHPVDGMYYWNGDVATKLRRMPGWLAGWKAGAMFFFKDFIIAIDVTRDGVRQPHTILWSESAEPGAIPTSWTATALNDAGETPQAAAAAGFLVDGQVLNENLAIIYGQDARFAIQYIGGNDVFSTSRMAGGDGLLSRGCIANTPKGHVFLTNGDVKLHAGGEAVSIVEGRIRDWLQITMDSTNAQRSFLAVNPQYNEVWVVFPSYSQAACDTVAAWDWTSDTWAIFSVSNVTYGTTGLIAANLVAGDWASDTESWESDVTAWTENEYSQNQQRLILSLNTPKIGLADTGTTDFGSTVSWFIEKVGISFDDSDSLKLLKRLRPQFDAIAGTPVSVYAGTTLTANGTPTYMGPQTFTVGTSNFVNLMPPKGRYLAVKFAGMDPQPAGIKTYDAEYTAGGRF